MADGALWVGLDLGRQTTNVCVIDDAGNALHEQPCASTLGDIEASLSAFPRSSIALLAVEAGTDTHIVRKLRSRDYPVAIFEARKASKFLAIRRNKTDSSDARGLADMARLGRSTVSQVHLKSVEYQQLRSKLIMRKKLVMLRLTTENMIRSRLALYGRPFKTPRTIGSAMRQVETQVASLLAEEAIDLGDELLPLTEICEGLRAYLKRLDRQLEATAKQTSVCRLMMEIPGVGPICALSFYSAIEDPSRFERASDVAAYLGLVPRRYQSGEVSRTLGITKNGSKLTRTHLVTSATVFRNFAPDCELKQWALRLKERVGSKRSRVALARKLAILLLTIWKSGSHFEPFPRKSGRGGA